MATLAAGDSARNRRRPRRRPRGVDGLAALAGVGLGAVVAQWLLTIPSLAGGAANRLLAGGQLAGLLAGYLALLGLLLAARVPMLDATLGLDRLVGLHARLGRWTLLLMVAHAANVTLGHALLARTGFLAELWMVPRRYQWVLPAVVSLALMVVAGVASWWRVRRRMRYGAWWALHLSMYLGVALAVPHQIANGSAFVGHPLAQALWLAFVALAFGCLIAFRVGLPLVRALRHRLRVAEVVEETPDVVSVVMSGVRLDRLPLAGGQFAHWRFHARGLRCPAHPYSISGVLPGDRLRITVRASGDHSGLLRRLRRGTAVMMEGPYGTFTAQARHNGSPVTLVAAGVGITPIRALLEDLPRDAAPTVLYRARHEGDLILHDEIDALVRDRGGTLHSLVGSRVAQPMTGRRLTELVPDIAGHTLYVCGPPGFTASVLAAAREAGVPRRRMHHEAFRLHPADSKESTCDGR